MSEGDRRGAAAVEAESDRRDSPRVRVQLMVRDPVLGGSFEPREGNLSLGGIYFTAPHPPSGPSLEIRLIVPGAREEVIVRGEVLHVSRSRSAFGTRVRFVGLSLDAELAIARFVEGAAP